MIAIRYFLIFVFFFGLFLSLQFSLRTFVSPDDGYYHIKHSWLYLKEGIQKAYNFNYLQFTTLKERPADIYFFYHLLLAPFTYFFNGNNYQSLINSSKIFHSFLAALFFVIFYFVLHSFNEKRDDNKKILVNDLIYLFLLFSASYYFFFRLLMTRPHTLSLIFLLLGFYFIVKKKYFYLFLLSIFYTLSYSISFLILILAFIYFVCWLFYYQGKNLYLGILPFIFSFFGLILGILLHPYPLNYLYNAYFVHLMVVFYRFFGINKLHLGGEMYYWELEPNTILLLITPLIFIFAYFLFIFENNKNWRKKINFETLYLSSLIFLFFLITLFIQRAIEYFIPFSVLFLSLIFKNNFLSFLENLLIKLKNFDFHKEYSLKEKLTFFDYFFKYLFSFLKLFLSHDLEKTKIYLKRISYSLIFLFFGLIILKFLINLKDDKALLEFNKVSSIISQNTNKSEIVFNSNWGDFPRLFFYNSYNFYVVGMDPTKMYLYDKKNYWRWLHISFNGFSCPKKNCNQNDKEDIYQVLKKEFKTKYVVVSKSNNKKLLEILDLDNRFEKIYSGSYLVVYKLKN